MALTRGTRLGAYEILELIGAGGMGEVYRARDPGLGRDVAIKVLPTSVGGDPDRVHRFEQEARAIGALNHPNILTVHATGVQEGTAFVVSELLDGDTLDARLRGGPMAPRKAVEIAIAIAHGLAAAHAKGIVHRDLKPANVFLPRGGPVKILDFGLAKLIQMPADETMAMDPGAPATLPGMVMGTVGYMSPEQVRGEAVDRRSDVFSFGVVLYEMIAGLRAFSKPTPAETMTAILNEDPPSIVRADVPPALLRILHRCLEKRAEDRFHSTDDLAFALDATTGPSGSATAHMLDGGGSQDSRAASSIDRRVLIAAALVIGALVGGAAMGWYRRPAAAVTPSTIGRFSIDLPAGTTLLPTDNQNAGAALALSPDGTRLVYVASKAGKTQLMLRTLDQLEPVTLKGTEGASGPFFSPDGDWIAFFADGKLKKLAAAGGVPLTVADVPPVARGGTWSEDNTILLTPTFADPIYKVAASGGALTAVTSLLAGESNHLLAQMLPGSKAFIFTVWKGGSFADASVWVWVVATGERRKLIDAASHARYETTGHLVFSRGNALLAVPFDPTRLAVSGEPVPVVDGVLTNPANGTAEFALSNSGLLVYASAPATPRASNVVWVNRDGREETIADIPGLLEKPRLSPDGQRFAVENVNDLWVYELATGVFRRVTFEGVNQCPVWSPDGSRLAFSRSGAGRMPALFWAPSDGSGQPEAMLPDRTVQFPNDWAPDGSILAFAQVAGVAQSDNWNILGWAPKQKPVSLVDGPFKEFLPAFSPDGRWLAYVSEESGRREVYVRSYPGRGAVTQITSSGADEPRWGRDGSELFFYHGDDFMRAEIRTAPAFSASRPARIFASRATHRFDEPGYPSYDVSADGRRFLMIKAGGADVAPEHLMVVLNWFEEVRRRAPQRR